MIPRCSIWKASSTSDPYLALLGNRNESLRRGGRAVPQQLAAALMPLPRPYYHPRASAHNTCGSCWRVPSINIIYASWNTSSLDAKSDTFVVLPTNKAQNNGQTSCYYQCTSSASSSGHRASPPPLSRLGVVSLNVRLVFSNTIAIIPSVCHQKPQSTTAKHHQHQLREKKRGRRFFAFSTAVQAKPSQARQSQASGTLTRRSPQPTRTPTRTSASR